MTEQRLGKVRVVMRDGARIRLANAEVRADTLFGHGAVPASAGVRGDQAIPLSDVASVARARVSLVRTGAAVLAGTAVTWVTVGFILLSAADFDF